MVQVMEKIQFSLPQLLQHFKKYPKMLKAVKQSKINVLRKMSVSNNMIQSL